MKKIGPIEREFGVPIPGKIVEPARWTKTALKKLPPTGPLDFAALFGRAAPLIIDLGCGNGRFLLGSALARPECDHLGIDILPMVLRYATRRGNQRGLGNLRFAAVDAQRLLSQYLTSASASEIHCYHPQPYYDAFDMHKRLLTPTFLARVRETLATGGILYVQTDNAGYWDYVKRVMPAFFEFHEQLGAWPDAPRGRTRREIIAMKRGYPIYRGWGVRNETCVDDVSSLPLPTFDAGPRRKDLDALERE